MKRVFFLLIGFFFFLGDASAQSGSNPFDVSPETNTTEPNVEEKIPTTTGASSNPFDLPAKAANAPLPTSPQVEGDSVPTPTPPAAANPFELTEPAANKTTPITEQPAGFKNSPAVVQADESVYQRFKFFLILGTFVLLTIFITFLKSYFQKVYQAFVNSNILNQLVRERSTVTGMPYRLLFVFCLYLLGVFLFLWCRYYQLPLPNSNFLALFYCVGGVIAVFSIKQLLLSLLRFVFPVQKATITYQFTIRIFTIILGLGSLPLSIWLAFGPASSLSLVPVAFIIIAVLVYVYRTLRGLFIGSSYLSGNILHFLLYLCTIEIAPVLIGIKWLQLV